MNDAEPGLPKDADAAMPGEGQTAEVGQINTANARVAFIGKSVLVVNSKIWNVDTLSAPTVVVPVTTDVESPLVSRLLIATVCPLDFVMCVMRSPVFTVHTVTAAHPELNNSSLFRSLS